MGILHGTVTDASTGAAINAKVHVLSSNGTFAHPQSALLKRGPGTPFFFSDGEFEVDVPRGRTDVLVERGTEYEPYRTVIEMPERGAREVEVPLTRWYRPQEQHWYPGNTHIHYDQHETRPDDRLAVDTVVEG